MNFRSLKVEANNNNGSPDVEQGNYDAYAGKNKNYYKNNGSFDKRNIPELNFKKLMMNDTIE